MKIKKKEPSQTQLEKSGLPDIMKKLMEENNIICSNKQLAHMIGIPYSTLQDILKLVNTNPKISTLIPISKFFQVSIEQLMGFKPLEVDESANETHSWNYSLYIKCLDEVITALNDNKRKLKTEPILEIVRKAYIYSLTKKRGKVDKDFIAWIVSQYCD